MDLELSDDQLALRDGIRSMLDGRFPMERVRGGFDRSMWDELAGAGVWTLLADGFVWADAVVVFEQLGRSCVPGPLVDGLLAHGLTAEAEVTGVLERPANGVAAMVEHLDVLDALLVLDDAGVWRVAPRDLEGVRSDWPLDPLTPVTRVESVPPGDPIGDADAAAELRRRGAVLTSASLLGFADRLTELAVEYARGREQFDRPIGSFQAVKHILADMLVRTEVTRAAVYAAGAHLGEPDVPGAERAIAGAKALAGEAAVANGKAATQVHGGMGYTWEVDVHLFLKRAWLLDTRFGSSDHHCDAVAASLEP